MKSSSAQLELDYAGADGGRIDVQSAPHTGQDGSAPLRLPDFGAYGGMYAVTARIAGRVNAASVPDSEHKALLKERQKLLDKKLSETITRAESNRLEYVRWSLDRIEDAKHGDVLDQLESYVNKYEQFLYDVRNLQQQLQERAQRRK